MKEYKSLKGYLHRFTVFHLKKLHVRIHHILRNDGTPFLHTHPFHYISIILSGGYEERLLDRTVHHRAGDIICHKASTPHRIDKVLPNTKTLIFAYGTKDWRLVEDSSIPFNDWVSYPKGIYRRNLYGKVRYCKFDKHWFKAGNTMEEAEQETKPSIDQTTPPDLSLSQETLEFISRMLPGPCDDWSPEISELLRTGKTSSGVKFPWTENQ